jgi:hypothetical protein
VRPWIIPSLNENNHIELRKICKNYFIKIRFGKKKEIDEKTKLINKKELHSNIRLIQL